jgi:hypothetical protein
MSGGRFAVFLTVVLSVWAAMHLYVFWRLASVPWVAAHLSRRALVWAALALAAAYPLARMLGSRDWTTVSRPLEFAGATWMGVLFLLLSALVFVEVITLGGCWLPRFVPQLRGGAVVAAAGLSVIALVQGLRPPVVRDYEVHLPGLPPERDGLVLVHLSDLHLGTLLGPRWWARVVERVHGLRPDLVVIVGDLVDGEVRHVESLLPDLQTLRAPLGVWAVTGNHEYYAGLEGSVRLLDAAGYRLLRDRWAEVVPGLVLAGVDDLTARQQFGQKDQAVAKALTNRPPGATILLSHTPWQADAAARAGASLMLSGHTHGGQIWPFNYLVQLRYPFLAGRYEVSGLTVLVGRGTGTWGPRMRLWPPGEILRVRLRAAG